ncbi:alcohol dehydrogenase catalytic domain-containing protein [Candidatus Nitrosocosmicus agrestis]|jgi:L-iditol 2-dehydrogenase|uniref:alcohol dehydrogenase catalytic domain-containing protein n=1 Tax=Candidatus Nitrosocosmicus agrestis TaxID=2563600 RepID=UPI00122E6253|nr:alcohol dehydrogenase catalytic domain-containing protein [Candidatus Nitrosocosmicus sp. SS]KAA2279354.1 alcohol dehydrogenase catalytic domain-containing protein [Candidatus Nitrosocosmicus sp. SS]KAF0867847.1 zinc-binding dehydrogenase [Candidatus Nitrosocosmicus sp. SS]
MRAAVFHGPNDVRIENVDLNPDLPNIITLETLSCSVCSYDVRTFRNGSFKVKPPIILGHEICAKTITTYKGENFKVDSNSRVVVYPIIPCFSCWFCTNKRYNLCLNLKEIGSTINGGFAKYIQVPKEIFEIGGIVPIPNKISKEEASLIEPLACCINGINQIKYSLFKTALILGDGPIGLMQLMLLKTIFPDLYVTIIGKINHRLEFAKKIGADNAISISELADHDLISLKEKGGQRLPNLIFVSNNSPDSINLAIKLVNKNGRIVIFSGIKKPFNNHSDNFTKINPNSLHYDEISIQGSFSSVPENLQEAISLVTNNKVDLKHLVTQVFSLGDFEKALTAAEHFVGLKSVVNEF